MAKAIAERAGTIGSGVSSAGGPLRAAAKDTAEQSAAAWPTRECG
jgi:hypothetical protein